MSRLPLRIGTRASPLAMTQSDAVRKALLAAHDLGPEDVVLVPMQTTGDRLRDRRLADFGGKGMFTKEIEEALRDERIDIAVHSMKDLPTALPEGLELACLPAREDPRDVFLSPSASSLAALPSGAVVGTAGLRRQAQVLRARPDLRVVPLRGNVETRLRKLEAGVIDATLLALAGLKRLDMAWAATAILDPDEMLPAVGQGAIGLEIRADDDSLRAWIAPLHDAATGICVAAERAFLAALDGSCRTPIAALAELDADGQLRLRGLILRPDGSAAFATTRRGAPAAARELGEDAGAELRAQAGPGFLDHA